LNGETVRYDRVLLALTIVLVIFGIMMVFSASSVVSLKESGNAFRYFIRHLIYCVLGLVAMSVMMRIDYHILKRFVYPILLGSLILLLLVLVPGVGKVINDSRRWIGFMGLTFQPAELAKLTLVIYLAYSLTKKDEKIRTLAVGFVPHIILLAIIAAFIMLEPDFGAAVTVGVIVFIMLFIAGVRFLYIVVSAAAAVPVILIGLKSAPYRWERITAFLDPWADPQGAGYHIIQSYLAFGSGGFMGTGLGGGTQKLFYIPYAYSDFIFAVIGEELGFFGAVLIVAAFSVFAVRGFRAARLAPDLFGTYLAMGITSLITLGAIMNIAVVVGLLPTKGMTLPLVSYGGSSLLVTMTAVGILLNVSGQGRESIVLDKRKVGVR